MLEQNPIYDFMKSNKLTDLDEKTFLSKYSAADKAKEIHSFFVENDLTDLDNAKFYDKYLKKKDQQEILPSVSFPTQSQSPRLQSQSTQLKRGTEIIERSRRFNKGLKFAKEGFLMQPEGTKDIPKEQEEMEPIEKQGLILNVISSLDKSFAKNFISSPIKGLGTALEGATKKVIGGTGEGFISQPLIKLGDYLNKTIDELTPQDEEFKGTLTDQVAQAFGQIGSLILTGGLTGAAGKGAALVSQIPKGSAALTAVKTLGSQLASPTAVSAGLSMGQAEFDRAIESGANDEQAFEVFYKNAAVGSVLETIPVMQFFKRFNNTTGGSVANYIKTKGVAGLTGGIEEMTTEVMQQLYSNKTAKDIYNINQDILDGVGASGGIGFGVGFVLNAMGANARILRKQGKQKEADVLDNQVKQYEDNIENPKVTSGNKVSAKDIVTQGVEIGTQKAVQNLDRDLANNVITPEQYEEGVVFTEKAAQVVDKIPETVTGESKVKSVELLVERNDIKQANQNLLQQKQTSDEAYHAGIDEEIKANEEKIKKIDSEVYDITKKPSKEFGTKKYEIDGEEVSQEAFEALTGKPIGTKEIIGAEVKPTEVDLTTAEKMNASQNRYGIVKDGAEAGFIVATNPENNVVKIKGVTVNEELRGKNIAGDAYVKLGESLAKEGVSLESDSFDKMEPSATRVWEKLADKGLAVKGENSYQFKPTEDINKVNVTIEGTTDGYKVISGDKANSIGDIRQEANEARAKGQDTFTKETVKDGKKIFTLTDTTVSDNFGRPGFKSASISFPEGTKVTMEDVMPKLKSELGVKKEVKPTEVKGEPLNENEYYHATDATEIIAPSEKGYKKREGANVVGEGIYFGKDKEHLTDRYGKNAIKVELDIKNPLISDNKYIIVDGREIDVQSLSKEDIKFLKEKGYDAVQHIFDKAYSKYDETIIFDKSQIKSQKLLTEEVKPTEVEVKSIIKSKFNKPINQELLETIPEKDISDVVEKIGNGKAELNVDVFPATDLGTDNKITNNQNVYLLHSQGKEIGVLTVNNETLGNRNESSIAGVVLHPDVKGKGIGKGIYRFVNNDLINKGKPPLKSDFDITPDAINVWNSLIKSGEAKQVGIAENGKPLFEMNKPTEYVKPTEVKSLEEEYDSKNVDELIALKKKLYPSPDIESPMTPEEKLLDRVIAKKFSEKQQEIISKRKTAAEKAPTKELAEGEEVTFNTPEGKKLTGEKITIPGFEKIDMVMVKEGLNNRIYDLASGGELVDGEFSKENLIQSVIDQFKKKNITQPKIYGLIYKGSNVSAFESKDKVRQINPSSMFESYSEKRKAYDKAEYEKLPLKYTSKEIEELNKLKDKAIKNGLDEVALEIDKRIEERGTGNKVNYYDSFDKAINNRIKEKAKKEAEKNKVPYPKEYIEKFPKVTEDYLKTMVNSGYKVDKFAKIPADVKKVMIDGLQLSRDFMNKYGYHPYEQSDNFFTKLLYFMNSVGARESRESKIIESKKELVSALDDLKKVHEKEFGKKAETEAKPKEGEVKSYSKKDLKDLEDLIENQVPGRPESFDGIWVKFKDLENNNIKNVAEGNIINFKDRRYLIDNIHNKNGYEVHLFEVDADNKVLRKKDIKFKNYNAEDLKKENDILKYDVAYDNNSYPESFVSLYTDIFSMKLGGYKNPKIGDVVVVFKKDYVVEGFIENKKNPDKTSVKLLRVDKDGNLLRSQDLPKKEIKAGLAKEEGEEEVEVEEPEQITKDDIKKAEAKFAAAEDRFKKARNKIEATQVKQTGMFGGEQKGMFAMGGEEAKSTLDPLRKAAKEAKAELDNVRNRIKVQEVAQPELKPIEKAGLSEKEIRQKESEIAKDYYKTFPIGKIKDGSIFTGTKDSYSTFGIEVERQGKQVAPETVSQIKKWAESRGLEYTGISKEDIRKTINFKLPFKESPYQQALKEKQEADKRQNRQIGSEKAAITKEIYRKVNQMDAPADAEQIALRYLADGGKVSKEAIDEAYGSVKRAQLNTGRRELLSEEVKSKDFVQGNETLDETAHRLWEQNNQRVSEIDIKNSLMAEIGNNNTRLEAAEAYLDNYNEEYKQEKEEMRMAEQYKEEYLEEQEKLEKELREPLTEQIEGEASEEHINNLIDQYESEIKGEDQQLGPASEGEINKEASKGKVSEKTQEAELAKDFKEATAKAGKKAKENAKKDFVERNFEDIVQKLKIQIKCPT